MARPHDLKPAAVLGARHPHGTKMRYLAGCRCWRCRRGNAQYEAKMIRDRALFGPNNLVSTESVRQHLRELQKAGIGHKTVAKVARVGKTNLAKILWYGKKQMRRRHAKRVLAVRPTLEILPKSYFRINPAETIARINQLTKWGVPYWLISRDGLGNAATLQIKAMKGRPFVAAKTAIRVRDYFNAVSAMRECWLDAGRRIPPRHYVYVKDGCTGSTVRSLELRPFAANHEYFHIYPPELKEAMRLNNRLQSAYRAKQRRHNAAA